MAVVATGGVDDVAPETHEVPVFAAKIERHRRSLGMLQDAIPGSRLVELLQFELETLDELPPPSEG